MKAHPTTLAHFDALEDVGTELARLRFDALLIVLKSFAGELRRQADNDANRRRVKMAMLGRALGRSIGRAISVLTLMWRISIPHMTEELKKNPPLL